MAQLLLLNWRDFSAKCLPISPQNMHEELKEKE